MANWQFLLANKDKSQTKESTNISPSLCVGVPGSVRPSGPVHSRGFRHLLLLRLRRLPGNHVGYGNALAFWTVLDTHTRLDTRQSGLPCLTYPWFSTTQTRLHPGPIAPQRTLSLCSVWLLPALSPPVSPGLGLVPRALP